MTLFNLFKETDICLFVFNLPLHLIIANYLLKYCNIVLHVHQ